MKMENMSSLAETMSQCRHLLLVRGLGDDRSETSANGASRDCSGPASVLVPQLPQLCHHWAGWTEMVGGLLYSSQAEKKTFQVVYYPVPAQTP